MDASKQRRECFKKYIRFLKVSSFYHFMPKVDWLVVGLTLSDVEGYFLTHHQFPKFIPEIFYSVLRFDV